MSDNALYMSPERRRRMGNALMADQYDRATPEEGNVVQRHGLLPLGTYDNGQTGLAFPGLLAEPVESFNRLLQHGYTPGDTQGVEDAFNVSSAAMMGGLSAPKPMNVVGSAAGHYSPMTGDLLYANGGRSGAALGAGVNALHVIEPQSTRRAWSSTVTKEEPQLRPATATHRLPENYQRPFSEDYLAIPAGDIGTPLNVTMDGNQIFHNATIAGRRTIGGPDIALSPIEQEMVLARIGVPVRSDVYPALKKAGVDGHYYWPPGYEHYAPEHINIDSRLRETLPNALPHEMGHAIHNRFGESELSDVAKRELSGVYSWLAGDKNGTTTPQSLGYRDSHAWTELVAEGLRGYMQSPGSFKEVAPTAARELREAVNTNPRIRNAFQLNANGGRSGAALGAGVNGQNDSLNDILRKYGLLDPRPASPQYRPGDA